VPPKYTIKPYIENGYYHVFNRAARRQLAFLDDDDYRKFLFFLISEEEKMFPDLQLIAFCLMPTHFHLLVFQKNPEAMSQFMQRLLIRYSLYFKKKYPRHSGHLWEGTYRARFLQSHQAICRTINYIFANPVKAGLHCWPHVGWVRGYSKTVELT